MCRTEDQIWEVTRPRHRAGKTEDEQDSGQYSNGGEQNGEFEWPEGGVGCEQWAFELDGWEKCQGRHLSNESGIDAGVRPIPALIRPSWNLGAWPDQRNDADACEPAGPAETGNLPCQRVHETAQVQHPPVQPVNVENQSPPFRFCLPPVRETAGRPLRSGATLTPQDASSSRRQPHRSLG